MDDPHAEVEIKTQLKPRGSVDKEEDPKPSHQLYKLQIKSTRSAMQTMSMEYTKGHRGLPQRKHTSPNSCGQEHTGVGPGEEPRAGPEISTGLEGTLGR